MIAAVASVADVPQLQALWKFAFGDDDDDIRCFFDMFDATRYALVLKDGDTVVSMLFLLHTSVKVRGTTVPVGYIYAGATLPSMRGKGCYRQLLDFTKNHAAENGLRALLLRPASDALEESYRRMGFIVPLYCDVCDVKLCDMSFAPLDVEKYAMRRRQILDARGVSYVDWDEQMLSLALLWCQAIASDDAIALIGERDGRAFAWEYLSSVDEAMSLPRTLDAQNAVTIGTTTMAALLCPLSMTYDDLQMVYFGYGLE